MELVQPSELLDRPLVIVDAEVDEDVGEAGVAAVPLDDEQGGRLLTAGVAAGRLAGRERLEQALRERPVAASKVSASASTVSTETRMLP